MEKTVLKEMGHYLKQRRLSKDLSQTLVAKELGCPPYFISSWEGGFSAPPLHFLSKLIDIYKIPQNDVLGFLDKFQLDAKKNEFLPPLDRSFDYTLALRDQCERLCELLDSENITCLPYRQRQKDFEAFRTFGPEKQIKIFDNFKRYVDVCSETLAEGFSLKSGLRLTWNMIKRLKLVPASDLLAHVEENDIIEIYDTDLVQVFRNIRFFEVCSYTLIEILTNEFTVLYRRDQVVTDRLVNQVGDLLSRKNSGVEYADVEDHIVEEIFSLKRHKYFIHQKVISVLKNSAGANCAVIGTLSILENQSA